MTVTWTRVLALEVAAPLLQLLLLPHRILNGSGLAPSAQSPSVVHRKRSHSQPGQPKGWMLSCKWTGRDLAPAAPHSPLKHLSVLLSVHPTEALTRHTKRSNRLPQVFPKETSSQNLQSPAAQPCYIKVSKSTNS